MELLKRPDLFNPSDIKAPHRDLPRDVTSPTIKELRMVIRHITSRKAALKLRIEVAANTPRSIQKDLRGRKSTDGLEERIPHQNTKDLRKCENYRDIKLLLLLRNVFSNVVEQDGRFSRRQASRSID
ncbi:unnamed protein product [Schistosoma mattheei]|uniref:Uncharacterized protein n=1 Tax=Schistosoma mattheei TaxID=31246 RepID=A0A183NVS2_9TREM|nr:unnamed protein product [Schistosoma mattheei]